MSFIDDIKAQAKKDKKTIVLPEYMDSRTYEAAVKIAREGIANVVLIGTPEQIAQEIKALAEDSNRLLDEIIGML
jgi:phosphate acetyltransferase